MSTGTARFFTSPRLRGEVGPPKRSGGGPGEGESQRHKPLETPPHPARRFAAHHPLPSTRAFTPAFDGLCGDREETAGAAR
jgi:hypothetical protein